MQLPSPSTVGATLRRDSGNRRVKPLLQPSRPATHCGMADPSRRNLQPRVRHPECYEESIMIRADGCSTGSCMSLPTNSPVCHSEHREESSRINAGAYATGSFTSFRMTECGHRRETAGSTGARPGASPFLFDGGPSLATCRAERLRRHAASGGPTGTQQAIIKTGMRLAKPSACRRVGQWLHGHCYIPTSLIQS